MKDHPKHRGSFIVYPGNARALPPEVMEVVENLSREDDTRCAYVNYDREVYNGDLGVVSRIDMEDGELTPDFDGRGVIYGCFGELDELVLAYATRLGEPDCRYPWAARRGPRSQDRRVLRCAGAR